MKTVPMIAAFLLILAAAPACESVRSVTGAKEAAIAQKDAADAASAKLDAAIGSMTAALAELGAEKDRLAALAARLEAGSAERAAIERTITTVVDRLAVVDRSLADATAASAEAKKTSADLAARIAVADDALASAAPGARNPGTEIGELIGSAIPGAAVFAPIVAGLLYRGSRLIRAKRALEGKTAAFDRVVASIDALAEIAPEVRAAIQKHAKVLDTIQTPDGKAVVDDAQSRIGA